IYLTLHLLFLLVPRPGCSAADVSLAFRLDLYEPNGFGRAGGCAFARFLLELRRNDLAVQVNQAVCIQLVDTGANGGTEAVATAATTISNHLKAGIFRTHIVLLI